VIDDGVVSGAGDNDIRSATAIDDVVSRTTGDRVGRGRTGNVDSDSQCRRVDVEEIADGGAVPRRLIGIAEIDRRRSVEHEGIDPCATIDRVFCSAVDDRVIAGAAEEDVSAANTVDRVVARADPVIEIDCAALSCDASTF